MELVLADAVKIALRTLNARERDRIEGLFAALGNWDTDPHIRKISHPIIDKNVYVLNATDGTRIFFNKDANTITVLDIAKKQTLDQFAGVG